MNHTSFSVLTSTNLISLPEESYEFEDNKTVVGVDQIDSVICGSDSTIDNKTDEESDNYYKTHSDKNTDGSSVEPANNSNLLDAMLYGHMVDYRYKIPELTSLTDVNILATDSDNLDANDTSMTIPSDTRQPIQTDEVPDRNKIKPEEYSDTYKIKPEKSQPKNYLNKTRSVKKSLNCNVCRKHFTYIGQLNEHLRTHHNDNPYKCDLCKKTFTKSSTLKRHIKTHSNQKKNRCTECGKVFKSHYSLNKHNRRTHTDNQPYKCDLCIKSFINKSYLTQHQERRHAERKHKCSQCKKGFVTIAELTIHEIKHTGKKPYKCKECGKCFGYKSNLMSHNRMHTGEKLYKCDICGRNFAFNITLTNHTRIHTGEKPYKCNICGKCFTVNSSLKRHRGTRNCKKTVCNVNNSQLMIMDNADTQLTISDNSFYDSPESVISKKK